MHGVVALAPWVLPTDPIEAAQGTPIVIIHGDSDRVALPARSRQIAEKLQRGAQVSYVTVRRGTHAMLRRNDAFDGLAARCVVWMLLGRTEGETVRRIAAGETWLEV